MAGSDPGYLSQINAALGLYTNLGLENSRPGEAEARFITSAMAVIVRVSGAHSEYYSRAERFVRENAVEERIPALAGVLRALRTDAAAGNLHSLREAAHAETLSNVLTMADRLLDQNLLLAAAIIGAGALEGHVRSLAEKYGIESDVIKETGSVGKTASALSAELTRDRRIEPKDYESIKSWLKVRNDALQNSADFAEYTSQQIQLYLASIRDFIVRNPA